MEIVRYAKYRLSADKPITHFIETPENIYKVKAVGDSIECVKYESHFERNLGNPSVLEISDIIDFLSTEKAKAELIQPLTMEEYFARERR